MTSTNQLPQFHYAGRFAGRHDVSMHAHPGSELVLVTEGSCIIDMHNRIFSGSPGSLFVIPRGERHNQREHAFTRTAYVVFTAAPQHFDDSARVTPIDGVSEKWVWRWIEDLCDLSESGSASCGGSAPGLVHALLERLKHLEASHRDRQRLHPALVRTLAQIDADPAAALSVTGMAQQAAVSPSYLTALFEKGLGKGPMQHVQEVRIARAKRLLGDPYLSVKEVGLLCGYDNPNYFSRLFMLKVGQTPKEYRRDAANG
jgi:AraC-like DNA-binding protein